MPPLSLPTLAPGSRVQHEFLVYERAEKKTNAGDPFVVLTLGNASGRIDTAPIWSDKLQWADGADNGRIVQAIGEVSMYARNGQAKRQLQLTAPLRSLPAGQFAVEDFLPRIDVDPARLWEHLDARRHAIKSPALRAVADLVFGDDAFRVQFERAPGSTQGHHAQIGGLLQHTVEVVSIALQTAKITRRANADLVVVGAMLHDIGKVESYEVGATGFSYTPCGLLIGHVVLGALMVERRLAALGRPVCSDGQLLELQHMILSHHGKVEYGSPVVPMTVEAEIVHRADEASAKATDMLDAFDDADAFSEGGEFSKRVWQVGRRLWKRPHDWE
jgi:3'-5' exoribonuclease